MGWERRGTAGPYYYRSERRGNRILKQYCGKGQAAQQAAREDEQRRATRERDRREVLAEAAQAGQIELVTKELDEATKVLAEASLLAAGFHRPNYGPWRKRREKRTSKRG